jgi:hypothetical protein
MRRSNDVWSIREILEQGNIQEILQGEEVVRTLPANDIQPMPQSTQPVIRLDDDGERELR